MKAILQCWVVIVVGGVIGLTAFTWSGNYEKGSAIDALKTQVQRGVK